MHIKMPDIGQKIISVMYKCLFPCKYAFHDLCPVFPQVDRGLLESFNVLFQWRLLRSYLSKLGGSVTAHQSVRICV